MFILLIRRKHENTHMWHKIAPRIRYKSTYTLHTCVSRRMGTTSIRRLLRYRSAIILFATVCRSLAITKQMRNTYHAGSWAKGGAHMTPGGDLISIPAPAPRADSAARLIMPTSSTDTRAGETTARVRWATATSSEPVKREPVEFGE